ncbi:glycosyltransferase, partial [Patescibacteria group bacterium]|nr:glycosyltransferase [Patescibacteria group bacterium]
MALKSNQIRVLHVITGLNVGGAEMMLYNLASEQQKNGLNTGVVSLGEGGEIKEKLEKIGVPVVDLGMSRFFPNPVKFWRLIRIIKQARPDVIQTWMYHANLIGGLAGKLAGVSVVWGIHHTSLDPKTNKRLTLVIARVGAFFSALIPRKIVYCSREARRVHEEFGYYQEQGEVINNGFALSEFYPDLSARDKLRRELGMTDDVPVIGLVGRWHPLKDHASFVVAAKFLTEKIPSAQFVLCGSDITWENAELAAMIQGVGLRNNFHLLGPRNDMRAIMNALDVCSLTSKAEAFPLVLGEAMACGVPCAVTDVGDCAQIVGDTGR